MIFRAGKDIVESEKERNLYTKFFAGYFLNELIEGYESRVRDLNEYLSSRIPCEIHLKTPDVSFDNHAYILDESSDRGEFADILIHDKDSRTMIAIEAKYLTNWDLAKDIEANLARIDSIHSLYPEYNMYHFLHVSKTKWEASKKKKDQSNSNYKKFNELYKELVGVIFWEELASLCASTKVHEYMNYRLSLVNSKQRDRYGSIKN